MLQGCVGKADRSERSDTSGKPFSHGYADGMILNKTLHVLSAITWGGWNFQGYNCILLYPKVFKNCLYEGREFQGARHLTEMVCTPRILVYVD